MLGLGAHVGGRTVFFLAAMEGDRLVVWVRSLSPSRLTAPHGSRKLPAGHPGREA